MQHMPRRLIELSRAESLRRLAGVSLGRIVFTERSLPAIRPIIHVVDGGAVIVRTRLDAIVRHGRESWWPTRPMTSIRGSGSAGA